MPAGLVGSALDDEHVLAEVFAKFRGVLRACPFRELREVELSDEVLENQVRLEPGWA